MPLLCLSADASAAPLCFLCSPSLSLIPSLSLSLSLPLPPPLFFPLLVLVQRVAKPFYCMSRYTPKGWGSVSPCTVLLCVSLTYSLAWLWHSEMMLVLGLKEPLIPWAQDAMCFLRDSNFLCQRSSPLNPPAQVLISAYIVHGRELMVWENLSWSFYLPANYGVVCSVILLLECGALYLSVFSHWNLTTRITTNTFPCQ